MLSGLAAVATIEFRRVLPADNLHVRVDVSCGLGTEVHVICVLVHIEYKHRAPTSGIGRVVRSPLIDESLVARRVAEHDPAGTAAPGLAHGRELGAPVLDTAEIAVDRLRQRACRG